TKDPSGLTQRTIPLRLQAVDLPDFISMLTWVDFTRQSRHEIAWRQLFTALNASDEQSAKPVHSESAMQSGPLPLPPQTVPAASTNPISETSTSGAQVVPPSLREMKKQALNKRLANLIGEYEAVNDQIDRALGDVDRLRLGRQATDLEQQI